MTIAIPDAYRSVGLGLAITSAIACVYLVTLITQLFAGRSPGSSTYSTLRTVRILAVLDALLLIRNHLTADTCVLAGIVSQFLLVANCMLNAVIALDVFRSVRDPFGYRPELWFWRHVASALTVAAVTALVPVAIPGAYSRRGQQSGTGCWLHDTYELFFYAVLLGAWVWCALVVAFFLVMKRRAERKKQQQQLGVHQRLLRRMAAFTALFVVMWLPQSIVRVCSWAGGWPPCHGTAIRVVARWMTSSIGIVDATTRYGPVCAAAARERVRVSSIAALRQRLRGCRALAWARGSGGQGRREGLQGVELGQLTPNPALAAEPTAD